MKLKRVKVFAPATISNLGSGFDVIGVAIHQPGDVVYAEQTRKSGLEFSVHSDHADLPTSVADNVAAYVATLMMEEFKPRSGVNMVLEKKMPIGSGLGSSAASSVAAAVAVNALLSNPLKKIDLLRFAVEGERKASGSPHADNAAPSLLGGACLIRSYHPLDVVNIPVRNSIVWIVVHPHLVLQTKEARNILPTSVDLQMSVQQWGNVGGLTIGLLKGDVSLIGKCVEDVIIEPVRAHLIPGFYEVKNAALEAGAAGCSISGAGPSLFAVAQTEQQAKRIGKAMKRAFRTAANVESDIIISRTNSNGATVVKRIVR